MLERVINLLAGEVFRIMKEKNISCLLVADVSKYEGLVMDIDDTLTDGKVYMVNDGELMKIFNSNFLH